MAITPIADYRSDVFDQLQGAGNWTNDEIDYHVQHAARVLSRYIPYEQESVLPVVDDDKEVDISSLTGLVFVQDIEFSVDQYPKKLRNGRRWGDYLTLGIDFNPDVTESTLTGTVTFAASTAVTGSGTDFDGEVEAGDYIKNSADTEWAKVRSVTSDTALVLARAYAGTAGADTVSLTPIRDYKEVVRIYWGGMHTVGLASTTVPTEHEQLIIDGACLYAKQGYLGKARTQIAAAISTFNAAYTAIEGVSDRVKKAVFDLESGRGHIGKEQATAYKAITDMTDDIRRAMEEIAVGVEDINKVTEGDNVPGYHAQYAGSQLSIGMGHLQQAQALMAQDQPAGEYQSFAAAELNAGLASLNQASSYLSEGSASLNAASLIYSTQLREIQLDLGLWLSNLRANRTQRAFKVHPRGA